MSARRCECTTRGDGRVRRLLLLYGDGMGERGSSTKIPGDPLRIDKNENFSRAPGSVVGFQLKPIVRFDYVQSSSRASQNTVGRHKNNEDRLHVLPRDTQQLCSNNVWLQPINAARAQLDYVYHFFRSFWKRTTFNVNVRSCCCSRVRRVARLFATLTYRGGGGGGRKTPSVVWRKCQLRFDRIKCFKHLGSQYHTNTLKHANVFIICF